MTSARRDLILYAVFLLVLAGIGAFCIPALRQSSESLTARALRTGAVRLGYAPEAPYAFVSPDGTVTGAWPEIARKVLQRMGIPRIEWMQGEFGSLLDDLNAGRCDIIASGMVITPERQTRASFSLPVAAIESGLLVRKGNPARFTGYADAAQRTSERIAVIQGAFEERLFLELHIPPHRLLPVPDARSGIASVREGRAAALALTLPTLRYVAQSDTGLEALAGYPAGGATPTLAAYAFRKQNVNFRKEFDHHLREFLNSAEYGALLRSFGFSGELPPLPTAGDEP